ncbi:hypothetical protein C8D96_0497 [Kushneria marisflavi]|nr:hypothetical protein C8D96_0497 [Kushneria marisflavi]
MRDAMEGHLKCPACHVPVTSRQLKRTRLDEPLNCRTCGAYVTTPARYAKTVTEQEVQRILTRYDAVISARHPM